MSAKLFTPLRCLYFACVVSLTGCGMNSDQESAVNLWLACEDCDATDLDSLAAISNRAVENALADALRGPTSEQQEVMVFQFRAAFSQILSDASSGVSPGEEDDYVRRLLSNYIARYQKRAAQALGRVGSRRARETLRRALEWEPLYRPDVVREIRTQMADSIVITAGNGQQDTVGRQLPVSPTVGVYALGAPISDAEVVFEVLAGGGAVTGWLQRTDSAGGATVGSWVLGPVAAPNSLMVHVTGDTTFFEAQAVGPDVLVVVSGSGDSTLVGAPTPGVPAVRAVRGDGSFAPGLLVRFRPEAGSGSVAESTVVTDAAGLAQAGRWTLGAAPGVHRLRASAGGFQDTVLVATAIRPPQPTTMLVIEGQGQTAAVNSIVRRAPAVRILGPGGAPVAGVRVVFTPLDSGGSVSGGQQLTGPDGIARVGTWRLGLLPRRDTLVASSPGLPSVVFVATAVFRWRTVTSGGAHTCGQSTSGLVYCWGFGQSIQMGPGLVVPSPQLVSPPIRSGLLDAGSLHTCVERLDDGMTYCWGHPRYDGIGDSSTASQTFGRLALRSLSSGGYIRTDPELVDIQGNHRCGVSADSLLCWGSNRNGQVGDGTTAFREVPTSVAVSGRFGSVSAGGRHTCALTLSGTAFCWGDNTSGQLGNGRVSSFSRPDTVIGGHRFSTISAGARHTCAIERGTGRAFCWGANAVGQLGIGSTADTQLPAALTEPLRFRDISAGGIADSLSGHTCAITVQGTLYCWGSNQEGQLGVGSSGGARMRPDSVHARPDLEWQSVEVGGNHSCAVTASGEAFCWGSNEAGQLGVGVMGGQRSTPTRVQQ